MSEGTIIAVIPARYGASRFPGKPLHPIAGKPLILRVMDRARLSRRVEEVYAATDDARIASTVQNAGGKAIMTSADAKSGSDRIAEAVADMDVAAIVNLQGDEPLMSPETIDMAVDALMSDPGCEVSTACVEIRSREDFESPHNVKVVFDDRGRALYFSRSPIPSTARRAEDETRDGTLFGYKHLGMYVYRKPALMSFAEMKPGRLEEIEKLEQLRYLENGHSIAVIVSRHDSPGVDTPEDALEVERALSESWIGPDESTSD